MSSFDYGNGRITSIAFSDEEIRARITELRGYDRLTHAQSDELRDYEHHLAQRAQQREKLARAAENPNAIVPGADHGPFGKDGKDLPSRSGADTSPGGRIRSLARMTLDAAHRDGRLPDRAAATVEALISRTDGEGTMAARWLNVAAEPAYESAFNKVVANPARGHLTWTPAEAEAFRTVEAYRAETRALGVGTGAAGDYLVPATLDPAIMLTSDGTNSPLRDVARVVQTSTLKWTGVTSAGATAEWKAEAAEAADGSPAFGQPSIDLHLYDVFVPFSYELDLAATDLRTALRAVMADAAASHTAAAYVNGTGAGQPKGLITALAGTSSEVPAALAGTLASGDVYALQESLTPRWQARASWLAALATLNDLDQMETTNGSKLFPELGAGSLLRHTARECSEMPAAAGDVLAYGDFKAGFVIADRIGATVSLIPDLLGPNGRPTGQRGLFLYGATGSDVVVPEALRVLKV